MYDLANRVGEISPAQHFLSAASVTPASASNLALVDAFIDSMRVALRLDDLEPLRRAVRRAEQSGSAVHDLLAAAEYEIHESLLDQGISVLHDAAMRLGSIIRDVRRTSDTARTAERRSRRCQIAFA